MARIRACPPGVFCLSTGLTATLLILLSVAIAFFLFAAFLSPRMSSLLPSGSTPLSHTTAPYAASIPSASLAAPVLLSTGGGDSRYDRAPQPLRDWMASPEFPPRGGLSRLPFNQPTQGLPESFQSVGLIRVEDKMLPLYGRRTAGGGDRWNYYTRTDTYNPIPLPVQVQRRDCMDDVGCSEVSSGDRVHIRGLQKDGQTEIYRFDGPKYIPGLL